MISRHPAATLGVTVISAVCWAACSSDHPFARFPGTAVAMAPGVAAAQKLPTREGTCNLSTISDIGERLSDANGAPVPGSGSAARFANGGAQVSYEQVPEITGSRVGDDVYICLIKIPTNCPPGDARGRVYTTTNLRTMKSWTLPDSQHECGGA